MPTQTMALGASQCRSDYSDVILREHRIYKHQLFGLQKPEDVPLGALAYDQDGEPWLKQYEEDWVSTSAVVAFSDQEVEDFQEQDEFLLSLTDATTELEQRYPQGLLAQTGVLTSDLIPGLVQNLASFDCRLKSLCQHVANSTTYQGATGSTISGEAFGCLPYTAPVLQTCTVQHQPDVQPVIRGCQEYIAPIIERERQMLLFITEYDAAYRTLLQLEGMNTIFLKALQWHVEQTLSPFIRLLGFFETIPCFVSSCDASYRTPAAP